MRPEADAATDTLSERAAVRIEADILAGALAPESRLGIAETAARYGVGATPVREALTRLSAEGIVTLTLHRGAYIRALQFSQSAGQSDVPAGVKVEKLKDIATQQGLPASYAQPWTLPGTAVQAYPSIDKEGKPGMAPANPADPLIKIPAAK